MKQELRLYTVSDEYIQYLSEFDVRVMSNKEERVLWSKLLQLQKKKFP